MKLVIAPDSFKESLDALAVARAIRDGLAMALPEAEYVLKPMADGGEGTVDAVLASTTAQRRHLSVQGPLGTAINASWAWDRGSRTATIEMAEASGLMRVAPDERDAARASSYGTGELIKAALDHGAQRIIVGLGGSATNDAGAGLLQALGARLLDQSGHALPPGGLALRALHTLDLQQLDPRLHHVQIVIASDVDNPLCGERGASAIFGPQKGADAALVQQLDQALSRLADVCAAQSGRDLRDQPGAGAAGGAGWALLTLGGTVRAGVQMMAELNQLDAAMQDAHWVITGEGRMDAQTLSGKVPFGVARLAQARGIPVLALVGSLGEGYQALYAHGLTAAFSLASGPMPLAQAMRDAAPLLRQRAHDLGRVIQSQLIEHATLSPP